MSTKQHTRTGGAYTVVTSNLHGSKVVISDGSGKRSTNSLNSDILSYLATIGSNVQTQLDSKVSVSVLDSRILDTIPGCGKILHLSSSASNLGVLFYLNESG